MSNTDASNTTTMRDYVAKAHDDHVRVRENLRTSSHPKRRREIDMAFQDGMMAAYQDVLDELGRRGE